MHPAEKVPVAELVEIFAYGLWRNIVAPCQIIDGDPAGRPSKGHNLVLSRGKIVHRLVSPVTAEAFTPIRLNDNRGLIKRTVAPPSSRNAWEREATSEMR
jgi:hypothetical protein